MYTDADATCGAWLRNLIQHGHLPQGSVVVTPIEELAVCKPTTHFFAGIGGWPYALSLAGWPEDVPVWTGSCPCQPFSVAGSQEGERDVRHLWPAWREHIEQYRPAIVFGEQVASPLGRRWLASVRADLEALGYAVGAADLCAAGVGAPHIRQRLYWVAAHADGEYEFGMLRARRTEGSGQVAPAWTVDVVDFDFGDRVGRKWIPQPPCSWLVDGVPGRVGRLRGYGNAIVPQVAAAFVMSFVDSLFESKDRL